MLHQLLLPGITSPHNVSAFVCPAVPATIVTAPANTSAKVSSDVTINCVAVGNLPITLTWFNGTKELSRNSRVSITKSTEDKYYRVTSTLVVKALVLEDTKTYSCRVVNHFGSHGKSFQITVQSKIFVVSCVL